jgi:hypothetical protein
MGGVLIAQGIEAVHWSSVGPANAADSDIMEYARIHGYTVLTVVICYAETSLETGIPEYKIPPAVTASCRFAFYDVLTGETIRSDTVDTRGWRGL